MKVLITTDWYEPTVNGVVASVVAATILTLTDKRFAFAAVPLAASIAFSRLYLYVHFPSDILGAISIGLVIGILTFAIGSRIGTWTVQRRNVGSPAAR